MLKQHKIEKKYLQSLSDKLTIREKILSFSKSERKFEEAWKLITKNLAYPLKKVVSFEKILRKFLYHLFI